jgi:glycosyltransferase involved in cell wall biosynthesis
MTRRRVLIIVENLPVPFDRRVWQEATTLHDAGYAVSIICPKGEGARKGFEVIDGIRVHRHPLPLEASGALGYAVEYSAALAFEFVLAWRVLLTVGFDAIHACNPPDLIFLVGGFFKLFGKRFLFDHHDVNPELFESKFGHRGLLYRLMLALERTTFRVADVSIATNESFRKVALERGGMPADRVFVVRSGPDLARVKQVPPDASLKRGRAHLVGYVGVMGNQDGLDLLLAAVRHIVHTRARRDIQFALVGSGSELASLQSLAAELEVADYVTFTGRLWGTEMLTVLCTADVCVNPDRVNAMNDKSTTNKVMEYMALGKPIVQFDTTEGRYSAQDASLYARANDPVDFADKILELVDDPARCRRMGELGERRVNETLQWRYEAPKLLAAYDKLFSA